MNTSRIATQRSRSPKHGPAWRRVASVRFMAAACAFILSGTLLAAWAQKPIVVEQDGRTISLEPYAPNILRVTMSTSKEAATREPGYGFAATPAADGWKTETDAEGREVYRSSQLAIHMGIGGRWHPKAAQRMQLDELNRSLRRTYFPGIAAKATNDVHGDDLLITDASGKMLLRMRSWSMLPQAPETKATDPQDKDFSRVVATFDSPDDEHYYGLGQQPKGWMDLRDQEIPCWHSYAGVSGEAVCVPFMVSSRGYGLVWDNPSKTTIDLGFNGQNTWSSAIGDRVSFFVITGGSSDDIYKGYRLLTGVTHMLPRATYGFIQSKAIYATQQEVMDVAKKYRAKKLPLDVMVVDFLNMTREGEMDLDPKRWPDPKGMNSQLHAMDVKTLLSVWPHFAPGTQFYDMLTSKGWFINKLNGEPEFGHWKDPVGPNIDTTNPDAAKWFWDEIRDRYIKKFDFDYIWLDETEPDVDPAKDVFHIGSGTRFFNVYPLFHTASVYDGFRRDFGDSRRVMILARAAYLGAQRNGTVFWSSDIRATWDMLKRSVPEGLNFTASGMPYWDTDIAGFFAPTMAADYHANHKPLINGDDVRGTIANYEDYPELFVRWFEWGAFQPIMRVHGERDHNEVWSYGKEAEPILAKYLKLRYQLLPYTYSVAHGSYETGAPYMRALFMDFPNDPAVANIGDEYMYGPAFLVAPVTEQGATSRSVYLPAGSDWYNYWTNERLHGGQYVKVSAPIDTLPLFVRAGSIVPLGAEVQSAQQPQAIQSVRVYPGANGSFALFQDDGTTYAYEKGAGSVTTILWDDAAHTLKERGTPAWNEADKSVVKVIGPGTR